MYQYNQTCVSLGQTTEATEAKFSLRSQNNIDITIFFRDGSCERIQVNCVRFLKLNKLGL